MESCETAKKELDIRNVESSQAVRHADLKRSLDRLVAAKESEEDFVDLTGVSLCFHHRVDQYRFNEVTGELELPVDWNWFSLVRAVGTVKQDLIAFQGNYQLLPDIKNALID